MFIFKKLQRILLIQRVTHQFALQEYVDSFNVNLKDKDPKFII